MKSQFCVHWHWNFRRSAWWQICVGKNNVLWNILKRCGQTIWPLGHSVSHFGIQSRLIECEYPFYVTNKCPLRVYNLMNHVFLGICGFWVTRVDQLFFTDHHLLTITQRTRDILSVSMWMYALQNNRYSITYIFTNAFPFSVKSQNANQRK